MSRRPEDVRAALATAAGLTAYDADHTWRDILFDPADPVGPASFSRPEDPDRSLLAALAGSYPELDAHGDALPERAHLHWLEQVLDIPRLPVVPDRVVAHATVDPKLAPAVLAKGTVLRGGKDAFGAERRYVTTDALTAHGVTVAGVRSLVAGGEGTGQPGLVAAAPPYPLAPASGADAPHTLRLYSPLLAFAGGTKTVIVTFEGPDSAAALEGATWQWPRLDGSAVPLTWGEVTGKQATVRLSGGCGVELGDPWLEASIPADRSVPTSFGFTGATVQIVGRSRIGPQAAYYNDGLLDVTKEFRPFGEVPRRGDVLYLRSDEAYSNPLMSSMLWIEVAEQGSSGLVDRQTAVAVSSTGTSIRWERREGGRWVELPTSPPQRENYTWTFEGVSHHAEGYRFYLDGTEPSEPVTIGGETGRFIRAVIERGDFGWTKYGQDMATFATLAAAGSPYARMPSPPTPPVFARVDLSYTSLAVPVTGIEAVNGWDRRAYVPGGMFEPFALTVGGTTMSADGPVTGMVAIGLDLADRAIGSSVSVYLEVESAAPCGSSSAPDAWWEWWDGEQWHHLLVADGSRLLRESGLLRFVAPSGWAVGCTATGADTGRWVRLVTTSPTRIGVLTSVTPDAVVATFVSSAADPQTDPSPATALPPGTIKGTLTPVAGVKKVTNLGGVRGRGPEEDGAFRRRASALARHRGRAITAWDYEEIVAVEFAEVAAVRCLPHTLPNGQAAPGAVGLVVIPDRPDDPAPRPSVSLSGRITDVLAPMTGLHATPAVLCPLYEPVRVETTILLRRGFAALTGKDAISAALEAWLHPTGTTPTRWGRSLYRSSLEAFLDGLGEVDTVGAVHMYGPAGEVEVLEVDPCRGLYCSSRAHTLDVQEQL